MAPLLASSAPEARMKKLLRLAAVFLVGPVIVALEESAQRSLLNPRPRTRHS